MFIRFVLWLNRLWHRANDARNAQWVPMRTEWRYDKTAEPEWEE